MWPRLIIEHFSPTMDNDEADFETLNGLKCDNCIHLPIGCLGWCGGGGGPGASM